MDEGARWLRRLSASPWLFDGGLALVAAGVSTLFFIGLMNAAQSALPRGTLALGYALVLLHTLPLAARRRFPGVVLASCVASGLAFAALGLPPVALGVAILVAVYSVAAYGERWVSLAGLAAAAVGSAAVQLTPGRFENPTPVTNTLILGAAWLLGHSSVSAAPTPTSWSGPPSWSGPGRSWLAGRWPRNAYVWLGSCMMWSRTASV
jgi:hypothetical protein